jgi:hypothetical protein
MDVRILTLMRLPQAVQQDIGSRMPKRASAKASLSGTRGQSVIKVPDDLPIISVSLFKSTVFLAAQQAAQISQRATVILSDHGLQAAKRIGLRLERESATGAPRGAVL